MTTQTARQPSPDAGGAGPGLLAGIREQADARPDTIALVEGDRTLTYAELFTAARRVAAAVRAAGARPGEPVGLASVRDADTVIAMLGILLADCGFVPLDPNDPPGRLAGMVQDAGVHVVVADPALHPVFLGAGLRCVPLCPGESADLPAGEGWTTDPEALAYVIHTSGTTGRPKGVGIPRRALEYFSRVAVDYYDMEPGDRILQFVSMSFDACIEEIFPPLLAGATIVLRDDEMLASVDGFLERCTAWDISILFLPTSYWHELTDTMTRDGLPLPASVRVVTAGGEEIRSDRVEAWRSLPLDPRVRLVNEYGPSECTVVATVDELAGPLSDLTALDEPTVGRPLPGVLFRINDDGELLIGGPGVGVGYLGRPELTAERFVEVDGERYYRTGDRVRLRPDGRLAFGGRMDRQLKVRGFRVEPTEVERTILAHRAVRDVAVDLDRNRGALVAYVILAGQDLDAVRTFVRDRLPSHSVPSLYVPVDVFPRNQRDKVDFAALHAMGTPEPAGHLAEATGLERQVADLAAEVLRSPVTGLDESLFDLGAHSLSLMQICTRIARDTGVRLSLAEVHARPTVRALAALISLTGPTAPVTTGTGSPGLTEFQRDVFLAEQFHPGTPVHTIGLRYRISGPINGPINGPTEDDVVARVGTALNTLVTRHDALRARVEHDGDEPVMVFDRSGREVPLTVVVTDDETERQAAREERGRTVLDAVTGDTLAATLILPSATTAVPATTTVPATTRAELVVAVHHLVFDGWSATVLAQDLAALLSGTELPEPGSFAGHLAEPREPALDYWRERLTGLDTEVLVPADRPRASVRSFAGGMVERPIPGQMMDDAAALARASGAGVATVVLAALQTLIARVSGHTDITVLSPTAHRADPARENTLGAFITVVPLRTDLSGEPDFRTVMDRAQATVLGALTHDDPPMAELPSALGISARADRGPLTQVMLIVQNTPPAIASAGDVEVTFLGGTHPGRTKLDLTFSVDFPDGAPVLYVEYAQELFDAQTAGRLADEFLTLLGGAVADPSLPTSRLPLLPSDERARILQAACAPAAQDLGSPLEAVTAHAATRPDAPAVSLGEEHWSYGRLVEEGSRIADELGRMGVGPGDRVAIQVPRSPRTYAAILGTWLTGAAYLPVDPDYPPERQEYLLTDGAVKARVGPDTVELLDDAAEPGPETAAYVLYTSGTTGEPKGVVVTHANLRHAIAGWHEAYGLRPGEVHLQAASFSFDVFAGESLRALTTGGHLVICPKETLLDADALHALFASEQVAVAELVPTVLRGLLGRPRLPHLRLLAGGAEKWYVHEYRRALDLVGDGGRVVNSYGVTEATVDNAFFEGDVSALDALADESVLPIGRPYPGNRLYVLDSHGEPVPYGTVGELWIGGAGVAHGYHRRPALTAARFHDDPAGPVPNARRYATGDAARILADGTVHLMGRLDDQVKVSGHRIELGEVETALAALPGVSSAAADVRDGRLVGYLVTDTPDRAARDRILRRKLPHFAVPAHLVVVPRLPLTPNGKVDRRALPDPSSCATDQTPAEPETPTQRGLAEIWEKLLGRHPGPDDAFFALGGDSFSALRMARAVDGRYGVRIALPDLYRNPVLRDLASHLDSLLSPSTDEETPDHGLLQRLTPAGTEPTVATLVCLPYSGGHALSFAPLAAGLPDGWVVYALQVPGRDWSSPQEDLPEFGDLIARTLEEVRELPGPIYLYGHCHGSAMTVELGRRMEAENLPLAGVCVGAMFPMARLPGRLADWVYRHFQPDRLVSDRAILDEIRALGGGFDEFADPDERAFAMRSVRHDERGSEGFYARTLQRDDEAKLRAPFLSIVGDRDRVTELYQERYREWEHYAENVSLAVIPKGGHGFLKHQAGPLAEIIGGDWPEPAPPPQDEGPRPSLKRFGVIAAGQFVSLVGSALSQLVMSLWVFGQTGRISDFAYVSAVALLPGILAGPYAGAVADRYDRRRVMMAADTAAGLATIVLIALMSAGNLSMWHVYTLCALTSLASAFQRPAYAAAISQLVPKAFLGQANGIAQLGTGAGALFAPMMAAPLLAVFEVQTILYIDVATFLVGVITLQFVRFPDRAFKKREESVREQIRYGWDFIVKRPGLVSALWFFTIDHIFYTAGFALITPLILIEHDMATLSLVLSAGGLGTLVGALVMSVWGGTVRRTDGMIVFMAINNVGLMVVGAFTSPWLLVVGMFTMSATESIVNGHWLSLIQAKVGFDLQGRVLSIFMTVMMLTMPLGYVIIGPAADHWFRPLLEPGGALAGSLGPVVGTGPGRGLALVILVSGLIMTGWAVRGWFNQRLRFVEDDLPDLTPTGDIEDRDTLQKLADARL